MSGARWCIAPVRSRKAERLGRPRRPLPAEQGIEFDLLAEHRAPGRIEPIGSRPERRKRLLE